MAPLWTFSLLFLVCCEGMARTVDKDSMETVISGTLYALEPVSGVTQYRLTRRHLENVDNSRIQTMRLDLGPQVAALDMELRQDSVWTSDSQIVVRRGDQMEVIADAIDSTCYLSGRLISHDGAATLNRCGRLSGLIQTNGFNYEIKEEEENTVGSELTNVKVTMKRSEGVNSTNEGIKLPNEDLLGIVDDNDDENKVILSKRQQKPITAEVAVYLDSNFANWMSNYRGKNNVESLTQWLIMKWNIINKVYGNERDIGVPFTIKLKYVEVWKKNPSFYPGQNDGAGTTEYLKRFCRGTAKKPNFDHKMLYTQGTGEHHMGMAYVNGICRSKWKCSLAKSKVDSVFYEIHEFGHSMGLEHDPDLPYCSDPDGEGGFMGWGENYRILDCYRRDLLKHIKERGARCLYEDNVELDTLNPSGKENDNKNNKNKNKNNKKNKNKNGKGSN